MINFNGTEAIAHGHQAVRERFRPRRSALYMPASNSRAIAKARELPCDVVILDLEDAVAPEAKISARLAAVEAVASGGFGRREVVVRINGLDTPWGGDDLSALSDIAPDAVLAPKVSSPGVLHDLRRRLPESVAVWAMIEICWAILALDRIVGAAAEVGLTTLVAGTNDLAKEMHCRPGNERGPLLAALSAIVCAGRSAGLTILDGVFNHTDDPSRFEQECRQGRAWGYDGKTLIHPGQIATANEIFGPSDEETAAASRIVEAFASPDVMARGVIRIDGQMVERLHLEDAQRTLAYRDAIRAAGAEG